MKIFCSKSRLEVCLLRGTLISVFKNSSCTSEVNFRNFLCQSDFEHLTNNLQCLTFHLPSAPPEKHQADCAHPILENAQASARERHCGHAAKFPVSHQNIDRKMLAKISVFCSFGFEEGHCLLNKFMSKDFCEGKGKYCLSIRNVVPSPSLNL